MSHQISVLVVEDELYSRAKISHFLSLTGLVAEVREAEHGLKGVQILEVWTPDIIIIDIHMPYLNGFELIQRIPNECRPVLIFTTAHEGYALRAFEVNALDYLLKPFSLDRFRSAFERAYEHIKLIRAPLNKGDHVQLGGVESLDKGTEQSDHETLGVTSELESIYLQHVRVEGSKRAQVILSLDDVILVRASGNYIELITADSNYLRRGALKGVVARLDPRQFMQINRSEVVRIDRIKEVISKTHGDAELMMDHGKTLKWTRRYRAEMGGRFEV